MDTITKFTELLPGDYTVTSYEEANTKFNRNYISEAEHENSKSVKFWSTYF